MKQDNPAPIEDQDVIRAFCKYCKTELINDKDKNFGYHLSCQIEIDLNPEIEPETDIIKWVRKTGLWLSGFFGNSLQLTSPNIYSYHNQSFSLLEEIPDEIVQIPNLAHIGLPNTQLRKLPDSIGELKSLKFLDLRINSLESLPESIGELTNLEVLNLSENKLISLPDSLSKLENLERLELNNNKLRSIDFLLGNNLQKLKVLNCSYNNLNTLPNSICDYQFLDRIFVEHNHLSSLPKSFGKLKLRNLKLNNNDLTSLPMTFGDLENIAHMDLSNNKLQSLPETFGNLNLLTLNLSNNLFHELPECIGDLRSLSYLDIGNNNIGNLPNWMTKLIHLEKIVLENIGLTKYPFFIEEKGQYGRKLALVNVSNNQLTKIPFHPNTYDLILTGNKIKEITKFVNPFCGPTYNIDLSNNKLHELPKSVEDYFMDLNTLWLDGNPITSLPESFSKLKNLRTLSLVNTLIKEKPESLKSMPWVKVFLKNSDSFEMNKLNSDKVDRLFGNKK